MPKVTNFCLLADFYNFASVKVFECRVPQISKIRDFGHPVILAFGHPAILQRLQLSLH